MFYEKMYKSGKAEHVFHKSGLVDSLYAAFKQFELHREDAVARLISPADQMLDIGCGNGSFIFKVRDKFKEIHGLDIASDRVDKARKLNEEIYKDANIDFRTGDIDEGLPYPDEYFGVITCIAAFEHMFDPYYAISEIKRILKRNGELILEVPNIGWLPRRISFLVGNLPKTSNETGWDGGHLHYFTVGALENFLKDHGFEVIEISGSGVFSSLRNYWVSLLSGDIIIKVKKIG